MFRSRSFRANLRNKHGHHQKRAGANARNADLPFGLEFLRLPRFSRSLAEVALVVLLMRSLAEVALVVLLMPGLAVGAGLVLGSRRLAVGAGLVLVSRSLAEVALVVLLMPGLAAGGGRVPLVSQLLREDLSRLQQKS